MTLSYLDQKGVATERRQWRIAVKGDLDSAAIGALDRQIASLLYVGVREISLDFSDVTFVGTREVAELAQIARSLRGIGTLLNIDRPSASVLRVVSLLEHAGLDADIRRWTTNEGPAKSCATQSSF